MLVRPSIRDQAIYAVYFLFTVASVGALAYWLFWDIYIAPLDEWSISPALIVLLLVPLVFICTLGSILLFAFGYSFWKTFSKMSEKLYFGDKGVSIKCAFKKGWFSYDDIVSLEVDENNKLLVFRIVQFGDGEGEPRKIDLSLNQRNYSFDFDQLRTFLKSKLHDSKLIISKGVSTNIQD